MKRTLSLVVALLILASTVFAGPTAEQRKEITDLQTAIKRAGNLFASKKFSESAAAVKQVQAGFEKLAAASDKETHAQLQPLFDSLEKAHGLLELEGYSLPPLKKLSSIEPAATAAPTSTTPAKPGTTPATVPAGAVSFTKQIAPFFVSRCGNCHVNQTKGQFSAATYEALMKGGKAVVIVPGGNGMPGGGILVDKIEEGSMPPNGPKVPNAEVAILKKWIAEGAKFDGPDPKANIKQLAGNTVKPPEPVKVEVAMATGKEATLFSRDVAVIFEEHCMGCHGDQNPRGNLSLTTFARFIKGGDSGAPIMPGKAADSLLVKKLKGTAGDRMPKDKPALAADVIAKVEKWVADGAKFDGPSQDLPMAQLVAVSKAKFATHDELAAERAKAAVKNWTTALPEVKPTSVTSENFVIVGNVEEDILNQVAKQAEAAIPKLMTALKHPADQPFVKGKLTLFVFKQRFDYTEFGQMVEKRQLPPSWYGHWAFTTIDAYGCVVYPANQPAVLPALVTQQVAGVYLASMGNSPHWFAEGTARALVTRMDPKDPRVAMWAPTISGSLGAMSKPDDFMTGKMNEEARDIVALAFCESLMSQTTKFNGLLGSLRKGDNFPGAFQQAYGTTADQMAAGWAAKGGKK